MDWNLQKELIIKDQLSAVNALESWQLDHNLGLIRKKDFNFLYDVSKYWKKSNNQWRYFWDLYEKAYNCGFRFQTLVNIETHKTVFEQGSVDSSNRVHSVILVLSIAIS